MNEPITAQQLAEAANESYNTVDHWAEKGILLFNRRGRRRTFPREENLRLIRRIRELQNKGHSLDGIREKLAEAKG